MSKKTKQKKKIFCIKGKGRVELKPNGKCPIISKNGTCPKLGHPCRRQ